MTKMTIRHRCDGIEEHAVDGVIIREREFVAVKGNAIEYQQEKKTMKKQIIKLTPELIDSVENNSKRATTRLGLKTKYHLGPVVFQNSKVPLDILDKGFEIYKIEAAAFCDLSDELANEEGYETAKELRDKLTVIYGEINDYATCTIIYFYL